MLFTKEMSLEKRLEMIIDFLTSRKSGTFIHIEYTTTKTPNKDNKEKDLKKSTIVKNRIGQKYVSTNNSLEVKDLGYEVIIPNRLKAKIDKDGIKQYYLEIHTCGSDPKTKYFIDNVEVEKEQFNECLRPSEVNKVFEKTNQYYIVNIKNITCLS